MRLTALDIREQQFRRVMRGFDPDEVVTFLGTVASEYEQLVAENRDLRQRLLDLEHQIAEFQNMEKALRDTLMTAERVTVETRENAQKEAALILREAEVAAQQSTAGISAEILRMRRELSELQQKKRDYLFGVRALAQSHLQMIDSATQALDQETVQAVDTPVVVDSTPASDVVASNVASAVPVTEPVVTPAVATSVPVPPVASEGNPLAAEAAAPEVVEATGDAAMGPIGQGVEALVDAVVDRAQEAVASQASQPTMASVPPAPSTTTPDTVPVSSHASTLPTEAGGVIPSAVPQPGEATSSPSHPASPGPQPVAAPPAGTSDVPSPEAVTAAAASAPESTWAEASFEPGDVVPRAASTVVSAREAEHYRRGIAPGAPVPSLLRNPAMEANAAGDNGPGGASESSAPGDNATGGDMQNPASAVRPDGSQGD